MPNGRRCRGAELLRSSLFASPRPRLKGLMTKSAQFVNHLVLDRTGRGHGRVSLFDERHHPFQAG